MNLDGSLIQLLHAQSNQKGGFAFYAYGFSARKKAILRRFLQAHLQKPITIHLLKTPAQCPQHAVVFTWSVWLSKDDFPNHVHVISVEDGFLRSVGLGVDLVNPLSWSFDYLGMYFDATRPSDLENILLNRLDEVRQPDMQARAKLVQERLIKHQLTKYNLSSHQKKWCPPQSTQRKLLVIGQVEQDASLAYGSPTFQTNLSFLQTVRLQHPDAYLVFKPHPDVVAKVRQGGDLSKLQMFCDEMILDISITQLFDQFDELAVMTSLTGFEALIRGKRVSCYGIPFYAGWGLTDDWLVEHPTIQRRQQRIGILDLIGASLIMYPSYINSEGTKAATVEETIDYLHAQGVSAKLSWSQKIIRGYFQFDLKLRQLLKQ